MSRIRWVVLGVAVFVISLGAVFVASVGRGPVASHANLLGKQAPVVSLKNLVDGTPLSTAPKAGHVVVVNFWNSWCIPCRQEQPALKAFYTEHRKEADFTMIGVLRSDGQKEARAYAAAEGMNWALAADPHGDAAVAFGTTGQPETYVIGPDGVVAAWLSGPASLSDFDAMLNRAKRIN
ncbi:MAG: thiol-disulfide isomerase-like thioredoxin [Actinomycetia bacterium]|nr:thiol-disulfide isomerase-like thioredoxin [Actinomycetes bacterium]